MRAVPLQEDGGRIERETANWAMQKCLIPMATINLTKERGSHKVHPWVQSPSTLKTTALATPVWLFQIQGRRKGKGGV